MGRLEKRYFDLGHLDDLAEGGSIIHRLDPRAKVITTLVFVLVVVSFHQYEITRLFPYFLLPVVLIRLSGLSFSYFLTKLLIVSPFVFFVAILNPFFDQEIVAHIAGMQISGGWLSFFSILMRFVLTVGAALILVATTGFSSVCRALEQLGVPNVFAVQLLFLYRYIFVLMDEGGRMLRSHALRSFGNKLSFQVFKQLVGTLLLRTIVRAERIHRAMLCRGFDGEIRVIRQSRFGGADWSFTIAACLFFILFRWLDVQYLAGKMLLEFVS